MITLCGSPISNYYNKVKLVLLEKGLPFTEERVETGRSDEATLSASPLAKVPFIRTPQGAMCESQVIVDYLEALQPTPALMPADPWQAAKLRELITFIELHLELVVRELYKPAFFGGTMSDEKKAALRAQLVKNIAAFKRLAKFAPYVGGAQFTLADCAAFAHLPLFVMTTKAVYGEDLLASAGIDVKAYTQMLGARASVQQVVADRKADAARKAG
jgi:glutathione S-transferase